MDEHQSRWLLLGYESVELVAVLVPLDRVQLFAVQIKVALEAYILPEHRVLRHYQFQHPQAVCFCNTHKRRMRDQRERLMRAYACVECYANARQRVFNGKILLKEIKLDTGNWSNSFRSCFCETFNSIVENKYQEE